MPFSSLSSGNEYDEYVFDQKLWRWGRSFSIRCILFGPTTLTCLSLLFSAYFFGLCSLNTGLGITDLYIMGVLVCITPF